MPATEPNASTVLLPDLLIRPRANMHATRTNKLRADSPMEPEPIASTVLLPN